MKEIHSLLTQAPAKAIAQAKIYELEMVRQLRQHCAVFNYQSSRKIGSVIASPAKGIFEDFRRDWALVLIDKDKFGHNLPANQVYIPDFDSSITEKKLCQIQLAGLPTNATELPKFLDLEPYWDIDLEALLRDGPIMIYKSGATSKGTTELLNQICTYEPSSGSPYRTLCIIPDKTRKKNAWFSEEGDSRSSIFIIINGNRAAVIGSLWGGDKYTGSVSYAIPISKLRKDIETFTSWKVVSQSIATGVVERPQTEEDGVRK